MSTLALTTGGMSTAMFASLRAKYMLARVLQLSSRIHLSHPPSPQACDIDPCCRRPSLGSQLVFSI
ncbi:uncharacterized protein BJ212DRAFT_1355979 [Suillus subaureus]|uniref:Uncharacterized protein n=1 Tax=Suillus subaureus TaxID=48587 RepID=A0A9P7EAE8_9AGAM|nr:uncharacterized protein BJ212DRAFT_1355979 [Suillus subaureus]KAG1816001.1 hypothetical protein BJ212DRAFT_1355979 [Suillus subaureus]